MALFLTQQRAKRRNKREAEQPYWMLRENYWDKSVGAQRQRHVAYIGKDPCITRNKAEQICREKGVSMTQLEAIEDLEIIEAEHVGED